MNPSRHVIVLIVALVAAALVWTCVFLAAGYRERSVEAYAQAASEQASKATRDAARVRIRALAADTIQDRARLAAFVGADIITAVRQIESVGPLAKVDLSVSSAFPEQVALPPGASAHPLRAVGFSVEATGSFAGVLKAAELLEQLPFPIGVEQYDIGLVPSDTEGKTGARWRLTERLRLLTDSDIAP